MSGFFQLPAEITALGLGPADTELVERAYTVAAYWHRGQRRRSGVSYIHHPAAVAATAAGLGLGVPGICAALLHDVIEDTDCTPGELYTEFGQGIAALVGEVTDRHDWSGAVDPMVLQLKLADRLHNLQTIRHLTRDRQEFRSRETLDVLVPAGERLRLTELSGRLRRLALETLAAEPGTSPDGGSAILGIDIENSTGRADPVKGRLRQVMYGLLERALREGGVHEEYREPFMDRGEGVLVLIDRALTPKLVDTVIPALAELLAGHNEREPTASFRLRAVVHAGRVHRDRQGCFGEALDLACRLLDAPRSKEKLRLTEAPLVLVMSNEIRRMAAVGGDSSRVVVILGRRQQHGWLWDTAPSSEPPSEHHGDAHSFRPC